VCDQNIAEARSIFRTSSSDRSETSPAGRRDARTRLRDLRRVHRVRLVAALDLACIERDRGPDVTGHDDQHLMWGALIRRAVACCTPAPAPAPLSLRDDRVEGATTELTAVGGPRVRILLPPAQSPLRTCPTRLRRGPVISRITAGSGSRRGLIHAGSSVFLAVRSRGDLGMRRLCPIKQSRRHRSARGGRTSAIL